MLIGIALFGYTGYRLKKEFHKEDVVEKKLLNAYGSLEVVKYDMRMQKALEILRDNNK